MGRVKIVVTVPVESADNIRRALGKAGAGKAGNYEFCSFSVAGTGRFMPNQQANPTIGTAGQLQDVDEERIEVTCDKSIAKEVIATIKSNHPYEEPVIDVYQLLDY